MFRIAKSEEIKDYEVKISLENIVGVCNKKVYKIKGLNVDIISDKYSISFEIKRDINEILSIKKYEGIDISKDDIIEGFITIDGKTGFISIHKMKIYIFSDVIAISFIYNDGYDYYGDIDIEIKLDDIKKLTTEK